MPIYEYQCRKCSHRLEKLQKLSDAALTECPECGEQALTKLVSAAGFRLKGGGWYETDFKKDGKRNLAGDDSKPGSESGGSSQSGKQDAGKSDTGKKTASSSGEAGGSKKSSGTGATSSAA